MGEAKDIVPIRADLPTTSRAIILRDALKEDTEQRKLLAEFVREHMKQDVDFGKIPGTDKDTLLKPGAEKLVDLFRCTPKFALITREEDFDRGFFNYMFRVRLVSRDSGAVLAEGFGSANSREGRYRWREAQRTCPACGKATIFKSREPSGGFYCWKKKDGCGAQFAKDDQVITKQPVGRVENDDIATLANTILKMAKKRSLVDGAIALARISDMFTQDEEDLVDDVPPPTAATAQQKPAEQKKTEPPKPAGPTPAEKAAAEKHVARLNAVWIGAQGRGVSKETFGLWVAHVLGSAKPSKDWTEEDLMKLEAELKKPKPEAASPVGEERPF